MSTTITSKLDLVLCISDFKIICTTTYFKNTYSLLCSFMQLNVILQLIKMCIWWCMKQKCDNKNMDRQMSKMKTCHYLHIEGVSFLKRFVQRYLTNLTTHSCLCKLNHCIQWIFHSIRSQFWIHNLQAQSYITRPYNINSFIQVLKARLIDNHTLT